MLGQHAHGGFYLLHVEQPVQRRQVGPDAGGFRRVVAQLHLWADHAQVGRSRDEALVERLAGIGHGGPRQFDGQQRLDGRATIAERHEARAGNKGHAAPLLFHEVVQVRQHARAEIGRIHVAKDDHVERE